MTKTAINFSKLVQAKPIAHIGLWSIYILYELTFLVLNTGIQATVWHFFIYYLFNIGLFYFNAHIILSYTFFRTEHRFFNSVWLILVELVVYLLLKFGLDRLLTYDSHPAVHIAWTKQYISYNCWRGLYFIGLSIAYFSTFYMVRFRERNHQIEAEALKAKAANLELENKFISVENAYLQNQISPHLLFNTLNFIYNSVFMISEKAGNGVLLLSQLMRYSLASGEGQPLVLVKEEIEQVRNLVGLCRLRFGDEVFLNMRTKGKVKQLAIIPLLYVTLVENMIKHGDIGDKEHPALIELERGTGYLRFETWNRKGKGLPKVRSGLGLSNLDKRLSNFYEKNYKLVIQDQQEAFNVILTLYI